MFRRGWKAMWALSLSSHRPRMKLLTSFHHSHASDNDTSIHVRKLAQLITMWKRRHLLIKTCPLITHNATLISLSCCRMDLVHSVFCSPRRVTLGLCDVRLPRGIQRHRNRALYETVLSLFCDLLISLFKTSSELNEIFAFQAPTAGKPPSVWFMRALAFRDLRNRNDKMVGCICALQSH